MKRPHCYWLATLLLLMCSGCGTQLALTGKARTDYLKAIKPYGALWSKPAVSTEEWRRDWVACGGMANGGYATDVPPRSPSKVSFEASKLKRQALAVCMREKGYVFTPDAVFREP